LRCGGHTSNRPEGGSAYKPERLDDGYKGITDTPRHLLNYWFSTDHRLFAYHYFQREAAETLI
jgi:hypothetical protein